MPEVCSAPLAFLGRHSLVIYLVHQPVIILLLGAVDRDESAVSENERKKCSGFSGLSLPISRADFSAELLATSEPSGVPGRPIPVKQQVKNLFTLSIRCYCQACTMTLMNLKLP